MVELTERPVRDECPRRIPNEVDGLSDFEKLLKSQWRRYPIFAPQDACKAIVQAVLGPEHFVSDRASAAGRIKAELETVEQEETEPVEPLGERFCRVHLRALDAAGISPATLAGLFTLSSRTVCGSTAELEAAIAALLALAGAGEAPFGAAEARGYIEKWREAGYPAISHSESFHAAYRPAYRVASCELMRFLPLFRVIDALLADGGRRVAVAIDGMCGSGKSTLAGVLKEVYGCAVFHTDDYFLRPEQRTPERYAEPGGNFDRERFLEEVLTPLSRGAEEIVFRPFDCAEMRVAPERREQVGQLAVVEGSYSLHPELAEMYDVRVMLTIDPVKQEKRILEREGEDKLERFRNEWIPLEDIYFEKTRVRERCDLVFDAPRIMWRDTQ